MLPSPAIAQLEDWEQPSRLDTLNKSFSVLAHSCASDFGFTQRAPAPVDEARDKLKAYLNLTSDGGLQEEHWLALMQHRNSLLGKDGSIASRASRGLEAAVDDPSTYAQAERLYVDIVAEGQREVLADCQAVADDPYIGSHYLTGTGTARDDEKSFKQHFASSVAEITVFKSQLRRSDGKQRTLRDRSRKGARNAQAPTH